MLPPRLHAACFWPGWVFGLALVGCTSTASLDAPGSTSAEDPQPTGADSGASSSGGSDETGLAPLAVCEGDCPAVLVESWRWEGPDRTRLVVELVRDERGAITLGTQRLDGEIGVYRLTADGALEWALRPGLPCAACELADIALHPSGDVLLSATDITPKAEAAALAARFDATTGTLIWSFELAMLSQGVTRSRAGQLAVISEDHLVQIRSESVENGEIVALLDIAGDGTVRYNNTDSYQAFSDNQPLLAEASPLGELIVSHLASPDDEEAAYIRRKLPPTWAEISEVTIPLTLDAMAIDAEGRRFELTRSRGTGTLTLLLTARNATDRVQWEASLPLITTSSTRPTLALGSRGDVYAAARITEIPEPGIPYETRLSVARWSSEGELAWQADTLLPIMATSDPLELAVDEQGGLIVGTVIDGQTQVVRYEQACGCG